MSNRRPPNDIAHKLEERLRLDEVGDDFSLINAPSVVSSLEQLSARGGILVVSSLCPRRRHGVQPLCPGPLGGGGGGSVGSIDTPRGSTSAQPAVFIDEAIAQTLCLGLVGSSGRFCVAKKARGLNHCSTFAHSKSKCSILPGSYYPPAGALLGKASAKQAPAILRKDISLDMLPVFESGMMTTARWEVYFKEAIVKGPTTPPRASTRRVRKPSPIGEVDIRGEEEEDDDSQAVSGDISCLFVDAMEERVGSGAPVWETSVEGMQGPADWTLIAREERAAIERICKMVDNLNVAVPRNVDALNNKYHPLVQSQGLDIQRAREESEEFRGQVGSLMQLVADHGSLSKAIQQALEGNNTSFATFQSLEEELHAFAEELSDCAEQAETSKEALLELINRVSAAAVRRSEALESRLRAVETGASSRRWDSGGAGVAAGGGAAPGLTGETSFGRTTVGTTEVELTMNSLFSQIKSVESRLQAVSDQARSTGVVFHRLAFNLEEDFGYWYLTNNPQGEGPSAFVDIVSIWLFGLLESGATEWLVDLHRSQSVGFKASPDTLYAHSMTTRYPKAFVGKVDTIRSADTIKMLASVDDWRGNGMGDGFKERLLDQLQHAVQSHAAYCEDYLPDGPVRQAALRTAQVTQHFFQTLTAYLDDELAMLSLFNLPAKQTFVLLSNQVVHICDDLFEFRNQAKGVDVGNRAVCATRYAWVTLQALGCMENYLRDKFRKHPGINSTYMRFLTRNLADQSSIGLKTKIESLQRRRRQALRRRWRNLMENWS